MRRTVRLQEISSRCDRGRIPR